MKPNFLNLNSYHTVSKIWVHFAKHESVYRRPLDGKLYLISELSSFCHVVINYLGYFDTIELEKNPRH